MRPTLKELEDLIWRAAWTGVSTAGALLVAPNVTGIDISALEAAQGAFLAAVVNVLIVYSRQKLGAVNPPAREQ
jgi:hypothetical protein